MVILTLLLSLAVLLFVVALIGRCRAGFGYAGPSATMTFGCLPSVIGSAGNRTGLSSVVDILFQKKRNPDDR